MPHFHRRVNEPLGMIHTSGIWCMRLRQTVVVKNRNFTNFPHSTTFHCRRMRHSHAARVNDAFLLLFSFFSNTNVTEKTVGVSGIRTRIVWVEGEHADHLTTTTAHHPFRLLSKFENPNSFVVVVNYFLTLNHLQVAISADSDNLISDRVDCKNKNLLT